MTRRILWILFLASLTLTLGLKAVAEGWFAAREPLPLNGQPALVFFTLSKGCECQMIVIRAAEAQLADWVSPLPLHRVDFDHRRDLAEQFHVFRAPALVLVDAAGQVVWKQDEGVSDESPLDLNQAERQVEALTKNP
ncbi:MAG: hypothetical protein L6Q26_07775 [Anaerolineales bacterium]|nr:hypothetical protein [Anaerolineales bacterium]NUQ83205.1 hypothetical protein [Anaerolineales bacterium]